jgi:transposase
MPILANGKTLTGRIWTCVSLTTRPLAVKRRRRRSITRRAVESMSTPSSIFKRFTGILQADPFSGYNELYDPSRSQGAITATLCWAYARRQRSRYRCQCTARKERTSRRLR